MQETDDDIARIKEAVASAEIGSLIDAWRMRFGTQWVSFVELKKDAFFNAVEVRLGLEGHIEYTIIGFICRLKERW
jgi:hypothetical protein